VIAEGRDPTASRAPAAPVIDRSLNGLCPQATLWGVGRQVMHERDVDSVEAEPVEALGERPQRSVVEKSK
jgi:hypothetical protein